MWQDYNPSVVYINNTGILAAWKLLPSTDWNMISYCHTALQVGTPVNTEISNGNAS